MYVATLGAYGDTRVPASDAGFVTALHDLAVRVAAAREAGNETEEIHWRREFQRLSNVHAQWKTGQAISDTQLTVRDYVPTLPGLAFGIGGAGTLAALAALAFMMGTRPRAA